MADEEWKNLPVMFVTNKAAHFGSSVGKSFSKYEASSLGQIRNKRTKYILSSKSSDSGYICNSFYDDGGIPRTMSAHVVIARTFLDEPESGNLTVDHINRVRTDNRVVNLRWATRKQQAANSDKSKCKRGGQPVIQYTMDMEEIKRWPNIITAAKELGIDNSDIGKVCRGKLSRVGGYKWAYERQHLDGEIWRNHKTLNVQISNMGRIKSPNSHIVYGSKTVQGYMIYGNPVKRVHVMVAETFLPNPEKKPEVNHKDKNRVNNKLENLEWATSSEQQIHSHKNNSNPNRYRNARAVKQYDLEGNFIREYKSRREASRQTECEASCISHVCQGLSKSTGGYIFKFSNDDVNQPIIKLPKKVNLIDERGNITKTYDDVKTAALDLEISYSCIYKILSGSAKKTKDGYRFKYH